MQIKTVYKYFNISNSKNKKRIKDIFWKNEIWFSKRTKLNDPFESTFNPLLRASKDQKIRRCAELQKISYGMNDVAATSRAKIIIQNSKELKKWETKNIQGLTKKLNSFVAICCFSKIPDDIVMWAHYANSHKGICIRFNYKNKNHLSFFKKIHHVTYLKNDIFPKFNFYTGSLKDFPKKILTIKSKKWKYEKECRGIDVGFQEGLRQIPHGIIDAIILGVNFGNRNLQFIKDIKKGYNGSLDIYKAKPDPRKHKLILQKLNL